MKKLDLWSDKGFPEVRNRGFMGVKTGSSSQWEGNQG